VGVGVGLRPLACSDFEYFKLNILFISFFNVCHPEVFNTYVHTQ